MVSNFPDSLDTFSELGDNISDIRVKEINDLQDAVANIESTLGINIAGQNQPAGWTLADRIGIAINDNGTLKGTAIAASDIPSGSMQNTKIYHDDTFEFKSIKVGQHADRISYGYSGTGTPNSGLTVDASGHLYTDSIINVNGTMTIKSSGDASYGDQQAFISTKNRNLVIQSGTTKDIILQPYEGDILSGEDLTMMNEDIYNFNAKYPYVTDQLQEQIIANPGTITEISAVLTVSASGVTTGSLTPYPFVVDILNNGIKVLSSSSLTYSFYNVTSTMTTYQNILFAPTLTRGNILSLNVKQVGTITTGEGLKVQVRVRRK